ncbi:hypothetical protein PM082_022272 [Marasmius tenuissimus]|nr:hypothetical protein PM082_022272 [Marasmius tenuissimus]
MMERREQTFQHLVRDALKAFATSGGGEASSQGLATEGHCKQQRLKYLGQWQRARAFETWDFDHALRIYEKFGLAFDRTRFSDDMPLVWEAIPWPVVNPLPVPVELVSWNAIEVFFAKAQQTLDPQRFRAIVKESIHRFHLDRWRAKGLLKTVVDNNERTWLEVGMFSSIEPED